MGGRALSFGFPQMHREAGERRDFLPPLIENLAGLGCEVAVERGIGSGMGLAEEDYLRAGGRVRVVDEAEAYRQEVVVVVRAPRRIDLLRHGAILVSMLHFPTRPARVDELRQRGVEAVGMDAIEDDEGRRLVVNSRAVAWNGLEAAFAALARAWPALERPERPPARVLVMGAGDIGKHAVEAATKFGSPERAALYAALGLPGVEVVTIGRNLTSRADYLFERLPGVDILVDATQRDDPSRPLIRNAWLGLLPPHAVICDLVVDPYLLDADPPTVRGIEGIPQGDLDRYVFDPEDPAWELVPASIPTSERRTTVSCYSWPGVHPWACMRLYGVQLWPLLQTLVERGGIDGVRPDGSFLERALWRGSLRGRLADAQLVGA